MFQETVTLEGHPAWYVPTPGNKWEPNQWSNSSFPVLSPKFIIRPRLIERHSEWNFPHGVNLLSFPPSL